MEAPKLTNLRHVVCKLTTGDYILFVPEYTADMIWTHVDYVYQDWSSVSYVLPGNQVGDIRKSLPIEGVDISHFNCENALYVVFSI